MSKVKRVFDIVGAATALVLLSPIFALIALMIKLDDRGPVFFQQTRIGHRGTAFAIWKFRTMVVGAERMGGQLTVGKDPRITRVGDWLRKSKLDELPQLFNVLLGDMSFVGPRPEVPKYVALYTSEQRAVLDLVPGITDIASIQFRRESELLATVDNPEQVYVETIMPEKIRLNLSYAQRATIWTDIRVILMTLVALVRD